MPTPDRSSGRAFRPGTRANQPSAEQVAAAGLQGEWPYNFPRRQPGAVNLNRGKTFPPEVLSPAEVQRLFAAADDGQPTGVRNRALLAVLYRSGLRCAEAIALSPKDLDLATGALTVLRGKGRKRRVVGLDPDAGQLVARWLTTRRALAIADTAPLFCTLRRAAGTTPGAPLSSAYVRALLPRLAAKAGIAKRVHPHGLRHTHAYELAMEGVPLPVISRQLGHTNITTTERYIAHLAPRQVLAYMHERRWSPEAP